MYNVGHYIEIFFSNKIETKAATVGTGTETTELRDLSITVSIQVRSAVLTTRPRNICTSLHYGMSLMESLNIMTGDVS